jgi:hypothetical protein
VITCSEKHAFDLLVILNRLEFIDEDSLDEIRNLDIYFVVDMVVALESIFKVIFFLFFFSYINIIFKRKKKR